jgi:pimeloyl-ACP methyl ester carboxylesterase
VLASALCATPSGASTALDVREVAVSGTTIAYAELGRGDPLVLLNGTASPMAEWDPALLRALAVDRRVVVFDYPGLGASGPPPAPLTMARMADWTAALIDALDLGTPDVLGWSMGGFVAQQLAIRHPGSVDRLVLAATNPGGPQAVLGPPWVQDVDSDPHAGEAAYLRTNYPAMTCPQARGRAFLDRVEQAVDSGRYPVPRVPDRTYAAMVQAEDPWLRSDANRRALANVRAPTLVITGARDVVTPPANSRLLARTVPAARLVLVPRAGHSFLFQVPERTARIVRAFLDQSATASTSSPRDSSMLAARTSRSGTES